jgi:hypothetical protein
MRAKIPRCAGFALGTTVRRTLTTRSRAAKSHAAREKFRSVASFALVALAMAVTARPAPAAPTDYDGRWRLEGTCSAATTWPWGAAITFATAITIQNGNASRIDDYASENGLKARDTWSGSVVDATITLADEGQNDKSAKWLRKLTGHIVSSKDMTFEGDFFQWVSFQWVHSRTCTGTLHIFDPSPLSLVGRELLQGRVVQGSTRQTDQAAAQQRQQADAAQLAAQQRQQADAAQLAAQQRQQADAAQLAAQQRQQADAAQLAAQQRQQADAAQLAAQQRQQAQAAQLAAQQAAALAGSTGIRVALVIGNGAYVNADALRNPANDAHAVANVLRQIGFEVVEGVDLNRTGLEDKLHEFVHRALRARIALLFYSGHGMQVDGKNYLVPIDAKLAEPTDLQFETVEIDRTLDALADPGRTNLVFLDACRDNPLARSFMRHLPQTRSMAVPSGLAAYSAVGTGTLIAYATAPGQTALDGQGANSPFTTSLLRELRVPGLEIRQMLTRVRADVATATGNRQIPWDNSSLMGDVYLTK